MCCDWVSIAYSGNERSEERETMRYGGESQFIKDTNVI